MSSYCKIVIVGNLTRDVELRYTQSGTAIAEVGIAINRKWKTDSGEQKEEVSFFNVACFGKQAEVLAQYTKKGTQILFDGRLKQETWDDKKTGEKRTAVKIIAEHFTFLGGGERGEGVEREPAHQPRGKQTSSRDSAPPPDDNDDVPF